MLQHAAQTAVLFLLHGFQVDFVAAQIRPQIVEHFRGGVSVGNVNAFQALFNGQLENFHRPFRGDQRFVVGRTDDTGAHFQAVLHDLLRRHALDISCRTIRSGVAQRLRAEPILAEAAVKVAAQHAEGQCVGAGQEMIEGFFLRGIALQRPHIPPGDHQFAVAVETHFADSAFALPDQTAMSTGVAAHCLVRQTLVEFSFTGQRIEFFSQRHGRIPRYYSTTSVRITPRSVV